MKVRMGVKKGLEILQNKYEMTTTVISLADSPHIPSRTITLFGIFSSKSRQKLEVGRSRVGAEHEQEKIRGVARRE